MKKNDSSIPNTVPDNNSNSNFPSDKGKDTIVVSNVNELMNTVSLTKEGNKFVLHKNGTYNLTDRL